ncbi:hypothetical protein ID866_8326 [Astraeus odoratus]|nr:hypothetical protein ID866_8326 [Astraeus odoratus]
MVRSQAVENKFSHKVHEDLIMVLEISCSSPTPLPTAPLVPTTEESLNECPRFRILVIGRRPSDDRPGKANIDVPLTSPANERFVLHDSNGFEPGEGDNLAAVESFIKKYRNQTAVGSQLHAIWLCFQIPLEQYGERMIEAGAEKFLREKKDILGNSKWGASSSVHWLTSIKKEWVDAQKNYEDEAVDMEANQRLKDKCIPCILNLTGEADIPYIAVSTRKRFKARLEHLIQLTQKEIQARSPQPSEQAGVDSAPALALAIAQRVAPGLKIKGSIEVGKRSPSARLTAGVITDVFSTEGYWKAVFSGADFPGRTIKDCLRVIHDDVVQVWNFRDTSKVRFILFISPSFGVDTGN